MRNIFILIKVINKVFFCKQITEYTLMQAIDKRNGKRFNYVPDNSPSSYKDYCHIICLF